MRPSKNTRGIGAYLRMVAVMPARTAQIAEAAGIKRENALDVLRRMHHHRLIHVAEWWAPPGGGTICEVWNIGNGPDAPLPNGRHQRPRGKTTFRPGVYQFVMLWRALEEGMTIRSLHELLGLSRTPLYRWMNLARRLRLVHISGWERQSTGPGIRIFKIGDKRNADYPAPLGKAEANLKHWAKRAARLRQEKIILATAGPLA